MLFRSRRCGFCGTCNSGDFFDIKSIKHVLSDVKKIEYKKTNYYKCLQEMNNFNISLDEDILDGFYTSIISFNSITELIIEDYMNTFVEK